MPTILYDSSIDTYDAAKEYTGTGILQSDLRPVGIASAAAFGAPNVTEVTPPPPAGDINPVSIVSAEQFGRPAVVAVQPITTVGIPSAQAFGFLSIRQPHAIATIALAGGPGINYISGGKTMFLTRPTALPGLILIAGLVTDTAAVVSVPQGWQAIGVFSFNLIRVHLYWKKYLGDFTDPSFYLWTIDTDEAVAGFVAPFSGVDVDSLATPFEGAPVVVNTSSNTSAVNSTGTSTVDGSGVLTVAAQVPVSTGDNFVAPTAPVELVASSSGPNRAIGAGLFVQPTAGKSSPQTYGFGQAGDILSVSLELRPFTTPADLRPSGVPSGEAFGQPVVFQGAAQIHPVGIASGEVFGVIDVEGGAHRLTTVGIASLLAFGQPKIAQTGKQFVNLVGIASGAAFGNPAVKAVGGIKTTGIPSGEAMGLPNITRQAVTPPAPQTITLYPKNTYSLRAVDQTGRPIYEFKNFEISSLEWRLNQPGTVTFSVPMDSARQLGVKMLVQELQVFRNGHIVGWYVMTDAQQSNRMLTITAKSLLWYFTKRLVGRAVLKNYLENPGFEDTPQGQATPRPIEFGSEDNAGVPTGVSWTGDLVNPTRFVDTLWTFPGTDGINLTSDIFIEVDTTPDGYSFANRFNFQGDQLLGGYIGLQSAATNPAGKVAIFSIWNSMGATANTGGTVVTGTESGQPFNSVRRIYPWAPGVTYRTKVLKDRTDSDGWVWWRGYIEDRANGIEMYLGEIKVSPNRKNISRNVYTFHERFSGPTALPANVHFSAVRFTDLRLDGLQPVGHVTTPTPRIPGYHYNVPVAGGMRSVVDPNPQLWSPLRWGINNFLQANVTNQAVDGQQSLVLLNGSIPPAPENTLPEPEYYVGQTAHNVPAENTLILSAWYFIPKAQYRRQAANSRGLYAESHKNGVFQGANFFAIDDSTEKDKWVKAEIQVGTPKIFFPGEDVSVTVRLYAPYGTIFWDRVKLEAPESTGFSNTDQATIAAGYVQHAQNPDLGKSPLNIDVRAPNTGVKRDRFYPYWEHQNIFDILTELANVEKGIDFEVEVTEHARTFVTYYPNKGADKSGSVFMELGRNILSYDYQEAGSDVVTSLVGLGEGSSISREAYGAESTDRYQGLTLEDVFTAPTNSSINSLSARTLVELARRLVLNKVTSIVVKNNAPDDLWTLQTGDVVTVRIDDGRVQIDDKFRIVGIVHTPANDTLTLTINPAIYEQYNPPTG